LNVNECESTLVRLLAHGDAIFAPVREDGFNRASNTYQARERFAEAGVRWSASASTDGRRKALQRALHGLIEDGLVRGSAPQVKHVMARLTDAGDALARKMCGLPGPCCAWAQLVECARLTRRRRRPKLLTDVWIDETRFGEDRLLTEEMSLQCLIRQWLISNCAVSGGRARAYYRVTAAGWAALAAGEAPPEEEHGPGDEECRRLYYEAFGERHAALGADKPVNTKEIGIIPLPVSIGGLEYSTYWG
jgi:hypothetical protein